MLAELFAVLFELDFALNFLLIFGSPIHLACGRVLQDDEIVLRHRVRL